MHERSVVCTYADFLCSSRQTDLCRTVGWWARQDETDETSHFNVLGRCCAMQGSSLTADNRRDELEAIESSKRIRENALRYSLELEDPANVALRMQRRAEWKEAERARWRRLEDAIIAHRKAMDAVYRDPALRARWYDAVSRMQASDSLLSLHRNAPLNALEVLEGAEGVGGRLPELSGHERDPCDTTTSFLRFKGVGQGVQKQRGF